MPKNKIKKMTVSLEVQFKAGDVLASVFIDAANYVIVRIRDDSVILLNRHTFETTAEVFKIDWQIPEDAGGDHYILGSDLVKELYGGSGTFQDLLNNFSFQGSEEVQAALDELPEASN